MNTPPLVDHGQTTDETFKAPLGLKLFLTCFMLLGLIVVLDSLTRLFR